MLLVKCTRGWAKQKIERLIMPGPNLNFSSFLQIKEIVTQC